MSDATTLGGGAERRSRRVRRGRREAARSRPRQRPALGLWPRQRSALGLWPRLAVVALVPMLGFGAMVANFALTSRHSFDRTTAVREEARHTTVLVTLTFALHREKVFAQVTRAIRQFGFTAQQAHDYAGIDLAADTEAAMRTTDAALARLDDLASIHPTLATVRSRLEAYRDRPIRTGESIYDPSLDLEDVVSDVAAATQAEVARLTHDAQTVGSPVLAADAETIERVASLSDSLIAVTVALYGVPFPSADQQAAVTRLGKAAGVFESSFGALGATVSPDAAAEWRAFARSPAIARLDRDIATVLASPNGLIDPSAPQPFAPIGAAFSNAERVLDATAGFVSSVGAKTERVAQLERDRARRSLEVSGLAVGGVVLLTVALVVVAVESIRRPVRRLTAQAVRMSSGDLDVSELGRGPKEIAAVSSALNEAVANMRRVAEQADALAAGDLDGACFDATIPGQMGAALHRSLTGLRSALQHQDELQQRLSHLAVHDVLTGSRNRAGALLALEHAQRQRGADELALLFIDLDQFKEVNDRYGHEVGDQLLVQVAARIGDETRARDIAARLGGDEFLVIADTTGGLAEAQALANRLLRALTLPYDVDGRLVEVSASIGVATALGRDASNLFVTADVAMRRAKELGKNRVVIFDDVIQHELHERAELAEELSDAIARCELEVWYQPIIDGTTLELCQLEALVRWPRPDGSMVSPGKFVPIAEQSDLIVQLDRYVLEQVMSDIDRWIEADQLPDVAVAVNLSGRHLLAGTLVRDVADIAANHAAPPNRIVIELTETVLIADLARTTQTAEKLHTLGFNVALDDFGTGFTSLGQLCKLPVDEIKIDASFVSTLDDPRSVAVVALLIDLARTLGLHVVAEGVETVEQLNALQAIDCPAIQGFLLGRPMPRAQLEERYTPSAGAVIGS